MELTKKKYNSDLLKGTGLIQETLVLIDVYRQGLTKEEFITEVIESNFLGKEHENRIKDIVNHVFQRRYLIEGEETVLEIKKLRSKYLPLETLTQILFIYTCRANRILFDFVKDIFQKFVKEGSVQIPQKAAINFIEEAIRDGRIEKKWADSTKKKVSEHINACLIDFKLTDRSKNILPYFVTDYTINYWMHKLHFAGVNDENIFAAEEFDLLGLTRAELVNHAKRISLAGYFIMQDSGELIRITWKYKSMQSFIDGSNI